MAKLGLKPTDELVRRAIIGDGTAFTQLWDTHIDALRSYLKATVKGLDDFYLDDICSRSFEKAFRQIGSFDPSRSQFSTWLRVIAHNTALDILEQEARASRNCVRLDSEAEVIENVRDDDDGALDNIIKDEDRDRTETCINALPELYRQIARLRLLDGFQYKEIAEITGLELNTVRTRIRRAKALIDRTSTCSRKKQ